MAGSGTVWAIASVIEPLTSTAVLDVTAAEYAVAGVWLDRCTRYLYRLGVAPWTCSTDVAANDCPKVMVAVYASPAVFDTAETVVAVKTPVVGVNHRSGRSVL